MTYYSHPGHEILARLRTGEVVTVDGIDFIMDGDGQVNKGDLYIGARNTVRLGVCLRVGGHPFDPSFDDVRGPYVWSDPAEDMYPFNEGECIKVKEAA